MSQVLIKHRAIINKFMGDGIFAFFNPPILQCDDHAVRACGAALDSLAALERLKSEYAAGPLADDVRALAIRMGINSGTVFVGDYGSTSKLDYTCIGDAVNLAARLEPANKLFGTRIMISEQTRCQLAGTFEARPLGRLQVVGKREAVEVYELLGRTGEVDDEQLGYAEQFSRAVEAFQQRRWDQAATELQHCARSRPDDPAIDLYRRHLERHRRTPPPEDWNRGIELTAK
jgi:adenylate cyclase